MKEDGSGGHFWNPRDCNGAPPLALLFVDADDEVSFMMSNKRFPSLLVVAVTPVWISFVSVVIQASLSVSVLHHCRRFDAFSFVLLPFLLLCLVSSCFISPLHRLILGSHARDRLLP